MQLRVYIHIYNVQKVSSSKATTLDIVLSLPSRLGDGIMTLYQAHSILQHHAGMSALRYTLGTVSVFE